MVWIICVETKSGPACHLVHFWYSLSVPILLLLFIAYRCICSKRAQNCKGREKLGAWVGVHVVLSMHLVGPKIFWTVQISPNPIPLSLFSFFL